MKLGTKKMMKKELYRVIAIVLAFITLVGVVNGERIITYAYEAQSGMIYAESEEDKTDAGYIETFTEPIRDSELYHARNFEYGKPVTVIDEVIDSNNEVWYKIKYKLKNSGTEETSYCPARNVLLDKDVIVKHTGKINRNEVSLRDAAGTDRTNIIAVLNNGHALEILDDVTVNSSTWFRVRVTVNEEIMIGWVFGSYVTKDLIADIPTDASYEEQLRAAGFPESYIKPLAVLHEQYPNWVFRPILTGLDWNIVIENESVPSYNLVQNWQNDALKSYEEESYYWETNTWIPYDGDTWYTANQGYLAYCMDPRNFLNAENIFMFESLSYDRNLQNKAGVETIIKGSFMENSIPDNDGAVLVYADAFMDAATTYGVSPYHLASRVLIEQGSGKSPLISGNHSVYPGYYNYFNITASGVGNSTIVSNGLAYAQKMGWNTRLKSILGGAKFLYDGYISCEQDTLYFQKFDVISGDNGLYWHQYMQNVQAPVTESKKVASAYSDKNQAFVFEIPIYENMPESAVQYDIRGNRNNYLKTLNVSNLPLLPTFTGKTTSYSVTVNENVESVTISATPVVEGKSKVEGDGLHALNYGDNYIVIKCISESGEVREYTINIHRLEKSSTPTTPSYVLSSNKYSIGTYITGISPETSVADFIKEITCENGYIRVVTSTGVENTGLIATGNKVEVYVNNTLVETKEIVIYGDVNGDGKISMGDLVKINRHLLELARLNGVFLEAGDVNHKGDGITMSDLVITNRSLLELTTITQ